MKRALAVIVVVAAAAYVIVSALREGGPGMVAFDVYNYFYPNMLHALRSLADGGKGLFWNPFQNCGQPFLAITESGLLYPLNVLFLVFEPRTALRALLFANLLIGGLGMYALSRELRLSSAAALAAALAFVLGNASYHLTVWMPTVQAPYMWMPAAMLFCERLVRAPSLRSALLLGIVLALSLLPGHPQFVLFTCQLVALRLLWAISDGAERWQLARALGGVALAMLLMLLLTAVQFYSSLQLIAESVRHTSLTQAEIAPSGNDTLATIAETLYTHTTLAPFSLVGAVLAVTALAGAACRRAALFYFLSGVLFLVLSLGDATALGRLYYELPIASLFRWPLRFRFVTAFCTAVLTGIAVDVLAEGRWRAPVLAATALAVLYAWLGHASPVDLALAGTVIAAAALAAAVPAARAIGGAAVVGVLVLTALLATPWGLQHFLAGDEPMYTHAPLLERLRERLTPQDRVHLALPPAYDPGFEEKTAMLFGLRATTDYETQMVQRYAEYVTMLRRGQMLTGINPVYFPGPWSPGTVQWPLIDLAAGRYVIIDAAIDSGLRSPRGAPLQRVDADQSLRIYENPAALPRAYYVPQIAVVPRAETRLRRMAAARDDPRLLALVEATPPSGFLGVPGNAAGAEARFTVDEPEHVVLETVAPERGFLFVADSYFPEWSATVNGQPTPVLVGNHAFRLVEVPKGPVTVEFRYRARRVWIGGSISAVTLLAVVAAWLWTRPHREARARRQPTAGPRQISAA